MPSFPKPGSSEGTFPSNAVHSLVSRGVFEPQAPVERIVGIGREEMIAPRPGRATPCVRRLHRVLMPVAGERNPRWAGASSGSTTTGFRNCPREDRRVVAIHYRRPPAQLPGTNAPVRLHGVRRPHRGASRDTERAPHYGRSGKSGVRAGPCVGGPGIVSPVGSSFTFTGSGSSGSSRSRLG